MPAPVVVSGPGPVIVTAIHAGHEIDPSVADLLVIADADRLREEDPGTDGIGALEATRIIVTTSRFQVDLNRSRERAVYREPSDAWGLDLWRATPSDALVDAALAEYDAFYRLMAEQIERVIEHDGWVLVLDVHSYNHRRDGAHGPQAPDSTNPEVNVGTGSLDRSRWASVVDALSDSLTGAGLDARENVKFLGGQFVTWVNATYPDKACALAIEFKKTFMDEWTGVVDAAAVDRLRAALAQAAASAVSAHEASSR